MRHPALLHRAMLAVTVLACAACGGGDDGAAPDSGTPPLRDAKPAPPVFEKSDDGTTLVIRSPDGDVEIKIDPGSEREAKAYYERIQSQIGVTDLRRTDLQDLVTYLGYGPLRPKDLEQLESDVLMDPDTLPDRVRNQAEVIEFFRDQPLRPDDILSIRFFAPKIMNLTGVPSGTGGYRFGWRKLVRLKARPGSDAAAAGIAGGAVLFNFLARLCDEPFRDNISGNTQAILTRDVWADDKDPLYFLVYDAVTDDGGGGLINFLTAAFDLPGNNPIDGEYYVPRSCAQCHGVSPLPGEGDPVPNGRLNYLDTDHWYDRIQPGDDFSALHGTGRPVLFDGPDDVTAPRYAAAFDVVRRYNQEVLAQNRLVDTETGASRPSRQTRGAEKWLGLHPTGNDRHVPPIERSLGPVNAGDPVWDATNAVDRELVPLLNQYCYRCHVSIEYSVFDKREVLSRASNMAFFIDIDFMPQDRTLTQAGSQQEKDDLKRLGELLGQLASP